MSISKVENDKTGIIEKGDNEEDLESLVDENVIQLVTFLLLDEIEYGIDILSVHEILKIADITRLPNVPSFIRGVINLRGHVIPVVDVRERFGFEKGEITDSTRIIVVETNDKLVGLIVDVVLHVVRLPQNNVDQPNELIEGVSEEFISGVGRVEDRLIVILSLDNMLFEESKPREDQ
ncbi:MAG: chemotaxis protein CheW [Spirochaetota bacterium]|nr:chemotaxis protein CheW [Spirochaetota bacterium]